MPLGTPAHIFSKSLKKCAPEAERYVCLQLFIWCCMLPFWEKQDGTCWPYELICLTPPTLTKSKRNIIRFSRVTSLRFHKSNRKSVSQDVVETTSRICSVLHDVINILGETKHDSHRVVWRKKIQIQNPEEGMVPDAIQNYFTDRFCLRCYLILLLSYPNGTFDVYCYLMLIRTVRRFMRSYSVVILSFVL